MKIIFDKKGLKGAKSNNKIKKEKSIMIFVLTRKRLLTGLVAFVVLVSILLSILCRGGIIGVNAYNRLVPIYSVQTSEKKLSISFDCAWGVDYTDKLLSIMEKQGVKCTFFMVEFWAEKHPDYVKKISDMGHEIGTHSATHPYMSKLSKTEIKKELSTSISAIENITNKKVELFRPPYGDYNNLLLQTAEELGLYTIQWSVDSLDWKDLDKTQISSRVIKRVTNGSIVLFHNQGLHTHDALEDIIISLKKEGFSFLPIGELIYKENYKILPDGKQTLIN